MSIYNIVINFITLAIPLHFLLWVCQAILCIFDCGQRRFISALLICMNKLFLLQEFASCLTLTWRLHFPYYIATEAEILVISGVPQMTAEAIRETFGILFKGSVYKLEIDKFAFEDNSVYITFTNPAGEWLYYRVHMYA